MSRTVWAFLALFAVAVGCATQPHSASTKGRSRSSERIAAWGEGFREATAPIRRSWNEVTEDTAVGDARPWNWASGVPAGGTRAEVIAPEIPLSTLVALAPELLVDDVLLASGSDTGLMYRVTSIGGRRVHTYADLHLALESPQRAVGRTQVDFAPSSASRGEAACVLNDEALLSLCQAVAQTEPVLRVAQGGNPSFIIRRDGIRCNLMVRAEREHGLLQVVLSLAKCWGTETLLPKDIRATCDGEPLECLSVAETLELLYGEYAPNPEDASRFSFASVSAHDDFLLPTNYNALHHREAGRLRRAETMPPALTSIAGEIYPGPPILADARALTGIMLQPRLCGPGMPERTGWVIFAGRSLRDGGAVELELNLGEGAERHTFNIPRT